MESDEDELLASSPETSKSTTGSTSHSTPVVTAVGTNQGTRKPDVEASTSSAAKNTNQSVAGKSVDEVEIKRLQETVEEYESFLKRKQSKPLEENTKANSSQKRNRSLNEPQGTQLKKPRQGESEKNSTNAARHFSDVARDCLQVAIIDGNSSSPNTIQDRWVEIDVRLSGSVLSYVLDNPAGPHPEFDSSETLNGYRVIKCMNQSSLDFLTSSVDKISNAFESLQLRLIPASEIPKRPRVGIWLPPLEGNSKSATANLTTLISERGVDISLIQEPWVKEDTIKGLNSSNFNLFYMRNEGKPQPYTRALGQGGHDQRAKQQQF
ncbi:uncharacterized protein LOC128921413 [Zeugodacus cucurbitae]|uniref:uncharacterized protein LOC128921413 n=1 Tax=Zeugodacus cucurbitae TaxID=28588 RepID=UPI0023D95364|nr:uncharacterized protein LOC128921413 [Zeugodacus cucurbitae]